MQYIGSSISQENVLVALERADRLQLEPLTVSFSWTPIARKLMSPKPEQSLSSALLEVKEC